MNRVVKNSIAVGIDEKIEMYTIKKVLPANLFWQESIMPFSTTR